MIYDINKPWLTLDAWQKEYIAEKGNCHLRCGRQSGKSAAASIKIIEHAIKETSPGDYLVIALTENQAYALFFKCLMYAEARYPHLIKRGVDKPTKHILKFKNGININCYAAGEQGMGLRHFTLKKLFVDECASMAREVMISCSPMLSLVGGSIDMLGTPMGEQGFFWEYSKREDFRKFHISAEDCPRHSKEFLENEKSMMTPLEYAQEYLGEFISQFRRVFSEDWIKKVCIAKRPGTIARENKHYGGSDLARMGEDLSVHSITRRVDKEHFKQVENIVMRKTLTTENERKIAELAQIYGSCMKGWAIDAGSGSMGVSILDHLLEVKETKNIIVPIDNKERVLDRDGEVTEKMLKEDLYNNLSAMGHWGKIELLDDDEIKVSLASVQFEYLVEKGEKTKLRIFGNYTHSAEAIIRSVWLAAKDKTLDLWVR
jgi:hypothetical protein